MIIFVFGEDTFRRQEKIKEIKERFKKKFDPTGFNLTEFKKEPALEEIMAVIRAKSFLAERRLVILHEIFSTGAKAENETKKEALLHTPEETIVVCSESKEPPLLSGVETHRYQFSQLTPRELTRWIEDRCQRDGIKTERNVVQELARRVGPDLWRMSNEIKKLRAVPGSVSLQNLEILIRPALEDRLFALMDAASDGHGREVAKFLTDERQRGTTDNHLFSMLIRQVRLLLRARALLEDHPDAKEKEFASLYALHPFVAQKTLRQARRFTLTALKGAHGQLFELERQIKNGMTTERAAVDFFLAPFLSG